MRERIILLLFVSFILSKSHAQYSEDNYMSPEAFSKMMVDYYNFALVGAQTPTTGFKVETAKPSISLKGNLYSNNYRRFVANLELEGGLDNGFMQLVAGKNVSKYFKGNLGLNFLLPNYRASRYSLSYAEHYLTNNATYNHKLSLARQLDTFAVIKVVTDDVSFMRNNFQQLKENVLIERDKNEHAIDDFSRTFEGGKDMYFATLIRNILIKYGAQSFSTNDSVLNDFFLSIAAVTDTSTKSKNILNDYDRLKDYLLKDKHTLKNRLYDFEIELTKVNWTWKQIRWLNVSLSGTQNNFVLYNSLDKSIIDSNSFLPAVTASINWLGKGKKSHQFRYYRGGVTIQRTNSLVDLQKFDYKKETVLQDNVGGQLKSAKEGVAYQGDLIQKVGIDVFAEGYFVPWNAEFIPGFHIKTMFRNSEAWINQNKVALDLGIIWNVVNNDKDAKNVLTIVPYASWSNLLKEYKDLKKEQERDRSDLFSFGLKFGIPVNIGK